MKIINSSVEIFKDKTGEQILKNIERAGRICYKSEDKITDCSSESFVRTIIKRNHLSVIEHESVSVKIVCSRGISHELVRHRIASFSQASQRYCSYKDLEVILPVLLTVGTKNYDLWKSTCEVCESTYSLLRTKGVPPQVAREVLPNSTKTEIIMTANLREWRHFFSLRCDNSAHPDMVVIAKALLKEMNEYIPAVFEDLARRFLNEWFIG